MLNAFFNELKHNFHTIEKATGTEVGLAGENWALNMEICDLINGSEDGPRDAVRAIRKLLQSHTGKDQATLLSTLTVYHLLAIL